MEPAHDDLEAVPVLTLYMYIVIYLSEGNSSVSCGTMDTKCVMWDYGY